MKADKSPAFQWYPKDVLSSKRVAMMTLAEEGAYRRSLDFCWLHVTLPADLTQLSMIIGKNCTQEIAEVVKKMFEEKDGQLRHKRLDKERLKQKKRSKAQSENGKKGGRPLKNASNLETEEEAETNPNESDGFRAEKPKTKAKKTFSSSSSSSSSSSELNNTHIHAHEVFDLKFFQEKGFEWEIEEPLRSALDKFMVWRQNEHPDRAPITSYTQVEEILREFTERKITPTNGAAMIDRSVRNGWKNIIYKLDDEAPAIRAEGNEKKIDELADKW